MERSLRAANAPSQMSSACIRIFQRLLSRSECSASFTGFYLTLFSAQSTLEDRFKSIEDALRQLARHSIVADPISASATLQSPPGSSRDTNLIGGVLPSVVTDGDVDHVDGMGLIDSAEKPHARYFGLQELQLCRRIS